MTKTKMNKKGQALGTMQSLIIGLVSIVIVLAIGFSITEEVQQTQTVNSLGYNSTRTGIEAITTVSDFLPIVALVAVGGVVLFFVVQYLTGRAQ